MKWLEHKIPPPIVALVIALAMWGLAAGWPAVSWRPPLRWITSGVLALMGLVLLLSGVLAFARARTTVNPLAPQQASSLVNTGVYQYTRNPMYVGMLLLLVAWAVYLSSIWVLWGPLVFVAYITRFQIMPEERALTAKFGDAFLQYQATVRRWF